MIVFFIYTRDQNLIVLFLLQNFSFPSHVILILINNG